MTRSGMLTPIVLLSALLVHSTGAVAQTAAPPDPGLLWIPVFLIGFFTVALIPTFVAFHRSHPNRWVILLVNVFLGGTGLGWFAALIWAMSAVHRTNDPVGSHGGESGLNIFANDPVTLRIEPTPGLPSAFAPPPLPVAPAAQPEPDLIDRLERLKRLHETGAIDDDQFRRMRDRLVAEAG